jgi:hypothetical protein
LLTAHPAVGMSSSPTPLGLARAASARALSSPATTQQLIIHPGSCWETVLPALLSLLLLVLLIQPLVFSVSMPRWGEVLLIRTTCPGRPLMRVFLSVAIITFCMLSAAMLTPTCMVIIISQI